MSTTNKPKEQHYKKKSFVQILRDSGKNLLTLFSGESARRGYIAAFDQGIISASNFLATLILARNVSPKELGVYAVGFIILRLARVIQEGMIIQPLNTFGASMDNSSFRRYASTTGVIQVLLAFVLATASALVGWVLIRTGNDTAGPTVFVLWLPIIGWQIQEYIRRSLYTRGKISQAAINSTISNAVRLGILIYLAAEDKLTGTAGLLAIGIGSLVAIFPGIYQTRAFWSRQLDNSLSVWWKNWHFGKWIVSGNILNWVSVEFYPIMAAGIISFAAAGAYRALQNLVAPIHMLLRAIDTYVTPRAAKEFSKNGVPALRHMLRLTYVIAGVPTFVLLVIVLIFPGPLLQLFYGEIYLEFSSGIFFMAIFYLFLYLGWPIQIVLKAARYSQPIFIANAAATVTMFTVGIWAIQQWGIYGTIAGQSLNAVIMTVVLAVAWRRFSAGQMNCNR